MITAITLENFKGISAPVTIPLRPLTIMFGKNSAGKSTVVQALHYAREILLRDNLNADRTMRGGAAVDLGGFRNLVNNHDETKAIKMSFEIDLSKTDLPEYNFSETILYKLNRTPMPEDSDSEISQEIDNDFLRWVDELSGRTSSIIVELKIEWSEILEYPVLTSYKTLFNKVEAVQILTSADGKDVQIKYNAHHPLLSDPLLSVEEDSKQENSGFGWKTIEVSGYEKTLPEKGQVLILNEENFRFHREIDSIRLTQMLVAPADLLREQLDLFRYLGPLRATPPRSFQPALSEDESDWANGLAAWRELYTDKSFAELWVSGEGLSRLKTGYRFELNEYREIPLESDLMFALENNTVFDDIADTGEEIRKFPKKKKLVLVEEKSGLEIAPHDIGVGISQVVPVIVAAFSSEPRMIAIEQPELHLHPAVQAELGDLFIDCALGNFKNFFLLETHSEHLILRVLRRIRECSEGEMENSNSPQIKPDDVQLIYVEPAKGGTVFYNLPVTKEGDFAENVPGGFFAERAKELF